MANSSDLRSKSLWMDIEVAPDARPLGGDQTCDVVVAGSGIAGISTAYELALKGQRVMVVDRGASPAASPRAPALIWRRCATI